MAIPSEEDLIRAIASATRRAVTDLFNEYSADDFYWLALITTGEAHPPFLSAWSAQAFDAASAHVDRAASCDLKWSYAESPFFLYGDQQFSEVKKLFGARPSMNVSRSAGDWQVEFVVRLRAMEAAMCQLDAEGLFGRAEDRRRIVINVEVIPPDYSNTLRALRLNPPGALTTWLAEAAEPPQ